MSTTTLLHYGIIIVLTLLSGFANSQGFIHSANIWNEGKVMWGAVGRAALGFSVGITLYWFSLRSMRIGLVSPEIQSIVWFTVTIIGVAIASRKFFAWQTIDQIVAVAVLLGIGWLLVRTGE